MSTYAEPINLPEAIVINIYRSDILGNTLKFHVVNYIYVVMLYRIILATHKRRAKCPNLIMVRSVMHI